MAENQSHPFSLCPDYAYQISALYLIPIESYRGHRRTDGRTDKAIILEPMKVLKRLFPKKEDET